MDLLYAGGVIFSAVLLSLALVPVASVTAKALGLVDKPSIRKRHVGNVPLVGGMILLAGLWCAILFLPKNQTTWAIGLVGIPLFLLGSVDDRFELSARLRILAQLGIGVLLVFVFDIRINQLDGFLGSAPLLFVPAVAVSFTVLSTAGVLNATNMADGIDGLLGSVASISLAAIAVLAIVSGALPEAALSLFVLGLLAGYLAFNLGFFGSGKQVFLGDSGSLLVGLVLLVLLVELSQKKTPIITPTSAGWLLGLPLLDTVSVMVRRIKEKRSPFEASRDHFHHVLQDLGLSRRLTLNVLVALQLVFVSVGIFANSTTLPQFYFFWAFVMITLVQFFGISLAVRLVGGKSIDEDAPPESYSLDSSEKLVLGEPVAEAEKRQLPEQRLSSNELPVQRADVRTS